MQNSKLLNFVDAMKVSGILNKCNFTEVHNDMDMETFVFSIFSQISSSDVEELSTLLDIPLFPNSLMDFMVLCVHSLGTNEVGKMLSIHKSIGFKPC